MAGISPNSWWAYWSLIIHLLSRFFQVPFFHFVYGIWLKYAEVMLSTQCELKDVDRVRKMQIAPSWTLVCGAAFKWTIFFHCPGFPITFDSVMIRRCWRQVFSLSMPRVSSSFFLLSENSHIADSSFLFRLLRFFVWWTCTTFWAQKWRNSKFLSI